MFKRYWRFRLSIFSKYRTLLMGMAAIMILVCHLNGNGVEAPFLLKRLFTYGNYGVDIFLLLSGMGLYCSLKSRTGKNIRTWYKKRFVRLLVPYLLLSIPYWIYNSIIENSDTLEFLLNISTCSFWTEHKGAWFIALIIPLYLLSPLIMNICKNKRAFIYISILIFLITGLSLMNWSSAIMNNVTFATSHVPCFLLGYILSILIEKNIALSLFEIIFIGAVTIGGFLIFQQIGLNIYWLLSIPISIMVALFTSAIQSNRFIHSSLLFMGTVSLESYLTNIYLADVFRSMYFSSRLNMYLWVIIGGITLSAITNKFSQKIITRL